MNAQISHEADREIHATFMESMKEAEAKKKQEIGMLTNMNQTLQDQVNQYTVMVESLPEQIAKAKAEVSMKAAHFEQMKTVVGSQMNEARDHYIKATASYTSTRTDMQ